MAFEPAAALIGLREGMEIFLVIGILLGILSRLGHKDKQWTIWAGFAAGILVAGIGGALVLVTLAEVFESSGGAEIFEVVVALAAVVVLSYMVLWMHKHAKTMVADMKARTEHAAATGSWLAVGALAFLTVLREGLEIVLFFGALAQNATWGTLIWSGLVGFGIAAALAFGVFRAIVDVDIKRFFAVSGFLIIIIAAGLLVHVGHAAADLGWIPHTDPLWDTSASLPDEDHWLGGPLHAFLGYEDQPTAIQLLLYLGYIGAVGGWYATQLASEGRKRRTGVVATGLVVMLLLVFSVGGALGVTGAGGAHDEDADHASDHLDHGALLGADTQALLEAFAEAHRDDDGTPGTVGLLVRQHGEWVHYNASTYESLKEFMRGIWPYTGLPAAMLEVDRGTYFLDEDAPFADGPAADPSLIDARLTPYDLPAAPVSDPMGLSDIDETLADGDFYFSPDPTGPGVGEGDLFELFGLSAYRDWQKMDDHSPMYEAVKDSWAYLAEHIEKHYGDHVQVEFAFHIDPKVDPRETVEAATQRLVDGGADLVFDIYQSSIHSDSMDTCMMRPHTKHALHAAGYEGEILDTVKPAGLHPTWAEGVADHVATLLDDTDPGDRVSVLLAQHGARAGSQNPCGTGEDQYHQYAKEEFALAYTALQERFPDRDLVVRHVYGQGAEAADDGVLSPTEALDLDAAADVDHAFIVPYEFWGNGMDNLVNLRENLGFAPGEHPYYDPGYTTNGTYNGTDYTVTSAQFSTEAKATALLAQIDAALNEALAARLG